MRSAHKKRTTLILIGLSLLLVSFATFVHADAAPSLSAAAVTPTSAVYIPLVMRYFCPAVLPPAGNWLDYVNYFRALACLPPVTENAAYSDGDYKHALYMVKEDFLGHTESSLSPYYTPEGAAAAQASNLLASPSVSTTDNYAIDQWMKGPFHSVSILDPKLQQVGFGSYREVGTGGPTDYQMAAALNVIDGLGSSAPASVTFPVKWPANGQTVNLKSYDGFESPDPLTSCGYTAPSGLPLIVQLGTGNAIPFGGLSPVTAFSVKQGTTTLPSCEFDENNYTNPTNSGIDQSLGRAVLDTRDAIVIIPRDPLTPGAKYTVSVTANSQVYTWSFTVSLSATALEAGPEALIR